MMRLIFGLIAAVLLLASCSDSDSGGSARDGSDLDLDATLFDMHFVDNGSGEVFVGVQLVRTLNNQQLPLISGEELWASKDQHLGNINLNDNLFEQLNALPGSLIRLGSTSGATPYLFLSQIFDQDVWYTGQLETGAPGTDYYASFRRRQGVDALSSVVKLPDGFSITSPQSGSIASRVNPLQINWSGSGTTNDVRIIVTTVCLSGPVNVLPMIVTADSGSYEIAGGQLQGTGNCSTTLEVSRSRIGQLDPNLSVGIIAGYQSRRITLTTTP